MTTDPPVWHLLNASCNNPGERTSGTSGRGRESRRKRYGDINGIVMVAAFGLADVEAGVEGFFVRFVVCFVVLVVGTTDVSGALGPDMCDEMAQIRVPIRTMTIAAIANRTRGLRYHATRRDGPAVVALAIRRHRSGAGRRRCGGRACDGLGATEAGGLSACRRGFLTRSTPECRTQSRFGGGLDARFIAADLCARPLLPLSPFRAQLRVSALGIGHVLPVQVGSRPT